MGGMLLGRDRELADVRNLLGSHRLVTVVGVGGVGKTTMRRSYARLACAYRAGRVGLLDGRTDQLRAVHLAVRARQQPSEIVQSLGVGQPGGAAAEGQHPELALSAERRAAVRIGTRCAYRPAEPVRWGL
jgi:ABC-type branched-subunit amino acid transport system ATPase component